MVTADESPLSTRTSTNGPVAGTAAGSPPSHAATSTASAAREAIARCRAREASPLRRIRATAAPSLSLGIRVRLRRLNRGYETGGPGTSSPASSASTISVSSFREGVPSYLHPFITIVGVDVTANRLAADRKSVV